MKMMTLIIGLMLGQMASADLTIYSDRVKDRFTNAIATFEAQTGQKVVYVEAPYSDILAKLQSEGANSPADLVMTKDLVYLGELKGKSLLQPMTETAAVKRLHNFMRDKELNWVGMTFRARSAVYDSSRTNPAELSTYEDLATDKWAGRLCLRTGTAAYNQALVAHLVATTGATKAKETVAGWVANMATSVFPNDNAAMEAVLSGTCDVAIVNHYYLAGMLAKNPNLPLKMAFLNQGQGGVHTNGTGVALTKASKQKALAQKFIDIVLSDAVQLDMSTAHLDYPAVAGLTPTTLIKDWGTFKMSPVVWSELAEKVPAAKAIINEVGYP